MKILKNIFRKKTINNKFSDFITKYSSKDRVKIIREAARGANKDQKDLVERYGRSREKITM